MLLLALDTSTASTTVALHDGHRVLAESTSVDPLAHGERLAPNLVECFDAAGRVPADVTRVGVGVGPGPYTGLRVGLVTARMFGFLRKVPVHGVCSLDALAAEAVAAGLVGAAGRLLVASDARRKEVYWACYRLDGDTAVRVEGPHVHRPVELAQRFAGEGGLTVVGRGGELYAGELGRVGRFAGLGHVRAAWVAEVVLAGRAVLAPEPLYLRRPDVTEPAPRS